MKMLGFNPKTYFVIKCFCVITVFTLSCGTINAGNKQQNRWNVEVAGAYNIPLKDCGMMITASYIVSSGNFDFYGGTGYINFHDFKSYYAEIDSKGIFHYNKYFYSPGIPVFVGSEYNIGESIFIGAEAAYHFAFKRSRCVNGQGSRYLISPQLGFRFGNGHKYSISLMCNIGKYKWFVSDVTAKGVQYIDDWRNFSGVQLKIGRSF